MRSFRRCLFFQILAVLSFAGCATHIGEKLQHDALLKDVPAIRTILDSLIANDLALSGFRATGTVILQSPELESTQISRESGILFRYPLDLYVVGRKYGTRFVELTCSGPSFLIQFPTEKQFYFKPLGERFQTVSSADMAREIFQPERWRDLSPKQIHMIGYDPAAQTATLEVFATAKQSGFARRKLVVQGSPWVVLENRLMDSSGRELAVTTKSDYYTRDGIRFPKKVESTFPGEKARMSFTMRKIDLNPVFDGSEFDIDGKVQDIRKRSFVQVETLRGNAGIQPGNGTDMNADADALLDDNGSAGPVR